MATERVASLGAQRVRRAEAGGLETVGVTGGKKLVPDLFNYFRGRDDFKSVLSSVPRAADVNRFAAETRSRDFVLLEFAGLRHLCPAAERAGETVIDELAHARPLQRHSPG